MATHSSILAWRVPTDRRAWWAAVHGVAKESDTTEQLNSRTTNCEFGMYQGISHIIRNKIYSLNSRS